MGTKWKPINCIICWLPISFVSKPSLIVFLPSLTRFVEKTGGEWFAGEGLTIADFKAWEVLDEHRLLIPGCLDGFKTLSRLQKLISILIRIFSTTSFRFMEKFESLPNIKSYLCDPRYKQFPIWSARATYGYHPVL